MCSLHLASTSLSRTRQATLSNQPMPLLPVLHRAIRKLHLDTCEQLGVEASVRAEVERLLNELAQLLVGISIMQVSKAVVGLGFKERDAPDGREQHDAGAQGVSCELLVGCPNARICEPGILSALSFPISLYMP